MSQQIDGRLLAAGGAFAVAVVFFGTTLAGAMTADVTPAPVQTRPVVRDTGSVSPTVITMQAVNEAVAIDPFSEERTPAEQPYRLPSDPTDPPPPPPPPAPPPVPAFRLVGTTQTPSGGIALIQVDNGTPRVISVGETLNGYTVEKIERVSATLAQGDRRVTLALQQPAVRATTAGNARRGAAQGRGANGRGGQGQDMAAQQRQIFQDMQNMVRNRELPNGIEIRPRARPDTLSQRNPRNDR